MKPSVRVFGMRRPLGVYVVIAGLLLVMALTVYLVSRAIGRQNTGGIVVPVPDASNCGVQLLAVPAKPVLLPGEPAYVIATFQIHGSCVWQTTATAPTRDFILFVHRLNPQGDIVRLANEETYWEEDMAWDRDSGSRLLTIDAEHPYRRPFSLDLWLGIAYTNPNMYDFTQPGVYTVTLIYLSPNEPQRIPSNTFTLTRLSPLRNNDLLGIDGPLVPLPDQPFCSVQLLVELNKEIFLQGEDISARAIIRVHGYACSWRADRTNPFREFILIIDRVDARGGITHLATEETFWENVVWWPPYDQLCTYVIDATHPYTESFSLSSWITAARNHVDMYDLSLPGTYTLRLIYPSSDEPYFIPSNVVTFTRLP